MIPNTIARKISFWLYALGLDGFRVELERIVSGQVTQDNNEVGGHFVGVRVDGERLAIIITTRSLREDDIVHELLHVRNPDLDHKDVVSETESLIISRNAIYGGAPERR